MADQGGANASSNAGGAQKSAVSQGSVSQEIIRRHRKTGGIAGYGFKEKLTRLTSGSAFLDSLILVIAFIALVSALGFYPLVIAVLLVIVLFAATRYQPFIGLLVYTVITFPIFMYQVPVLAWVFLLAATLILIYGYKHYRVMAFVYLLVALAFSPAGYILEIPAFVLGALTIGNKRSILTLVVVFVLVVTYSAVTGIQNTGYIAYNAATAHAALGSSPVIALDSGAKPALSLGNFSSSAGPALSAFFGPASAQIGSAFGTIAQALTLNPAYVAQLAALIATAILIDWYASKSRSKLKGVMSSLFGVIYPISYIAIIVATAAPSFSSTALPLLSFLIAPVGLYIAESSGISVVRVLDVKKQDIRMKFGEAFEDLSAGNVSERFDDIGDYESTKKELREAIIAPIEERAISAAYNVKPSKGILFFGPPGTGKTMMMRALANEIHAGFFYVKASNMISAYPGESERMISNVFAIARKNAPCVLFFDEIDAIALGREAANVDDAHRHALSQLLVEMDGFQAIKNVIVVGATNRPDLIDAAMMRPGRFDRLIYMPLPDLDGRKKILQIYLNKLPIDDGINITDIAKGMERYSGADIKAATETVAQMVAQEAANEHKVLVITQQDIMNVVKSTKPSTSLSQLDTYKRFKIDYERNLTPESQVEEKKGVALTDVIGLESAKKALREAIEIPLTKPELIKKYDIKVINGILLFGPPGNGKTMLMKAVNNEMHGVTMLELSGAEIAQAGIEKATATIKEIFNRARENEPAVIFIDEVDGLVPKREGSSEFSVQMTSELLKEIDGLKDTSNIVVIGATNRPYMLDPAILRPGRFDKLIYVKPPGPKSRGELFRKYLSQVPTAGDVNYAQLGAETKGFTGADIAGVCREAKTAAMEEELSSGQEGHVTMQALEGVIKNMKPSAPDEVLNDYVDFMAKYGQR